VLHNSLYQSSSDCTNKPIIKRVYCQCHHDLKLPCSTKIISHIIKRLRDSDSSIRTACCDAYGVLLGLHLKDRVRCWLSHYLRPCRRQTKVCNWVLLCIW
jgi:hypothetical protein